MFHQELHGDSSLSPGFQASDFVNNMRSDSYLYKVKAFVQLRCSWSFQRETYWWWALYTLKHISITVTKQDCTINYCQRRLFYAAWRMLTRVLCQFKYSVQKNAWVDSEIFADWFHKKFVPAVKNHMSSPAKVLILLDNAPCSSKWKCLAELWQKHQSKA